MFQKHFHLTGLICTILLAAMACSLPTAAQPTTMPEQSSIQALAATQTALAGQPTTTPAPLLPSPSETTMIPKITKTPTLPVGVFPTATPTLTPEPVFANVTKETNCRNGPGGHYDLVTTFQVGVKIEVLARDFTNGFIYVKNLQKPEEQCYIPITNVTLSGDPTILPQYTAPPSPTAAPNFTLKFKKFDTCKGNILAQFVVQNTGSIPFRSAYIRVVDLKTNQTVEAVVDAFDLTTGCIIAKNIAPLNGGETGYLSSPTFTKDPRGNKLRATVQACTEKGLKGTCIARTVEIKP